MNLEKRLSSNKSEREEIRQNIKDILAEGNNELGISSILEHSGNNNETDILEYCTPNYATNTSKLFSTKDKPNLNNPSSEKWDSGEKMFVDIQNLESFSLCPHKSPKNKLNLNKESQKLIEELKSLEEENRRDEEKEILYSGEINAEDLVQESSKSILYPF